MIDLSPEQVIELPVDQVGLVIPGDLIATGQWNEYNYLLAANGEYSGEALLAVTEAVAWLRARALIARAPGQTSDAAISVTRTGRGYYPRRTPPCGTSRTRPFAVHVLARCVQSDTWTTPRRGSAAH